MMTIKIKTLIIAIVLSSMPIVIYGQIPLPTGVISTFEAYTGLGAVTNSGMFTGDVGTDNGALTGFAGLPSFVGTAYNNDATTAQARADMLWMYINLNNMPVTDFNHLAAFGSGESLTPGVYSIASAGTLAGTITLNGGVNDFFIFKFEGAFTAGAGATVVLAGGITSANVFWIANGAITITPTVTSNVTTINGTLISYPGAITLGENCNLEGRMLTTEGAITNDINSIAQIPPDACTITLQCLDACNPVHDVLGTISNFIFFTSNGAVTNVSTSGIVGNIGADIGSISGFTSSTHIGSFHLGNAITNQAAADLSNAYTLLMSIPASPGPAHGAAFGLPVLPGEILLPGVYDIATAADLTGFITLDGGGDPNAVFIIRINGAFSVATRARVILANGTRVCNVFWIATGVHAIDMGTWSFVRGTLIAGGACTMAASGNVEGRMLSRNGAIGFSTGTAYNEPLCLTPVPLAIELLSFNVEASNARVQLDWSTATETDNDYFTVESSQDGIVWEAIEDIKGAGNSSSLSRYSTTDLNPYIGLSNYRLKQTDFSGQFSYSQIRSVVIERFINKQIDLYPNPVKHQLTIRSSEAELSEISVFNILGQDFTELIQEKTKDNSTVIIDMQNLSSGFYYIRTKTRINKIYKE